MVSNLSIQEEVDTEKTAEKTRGLLKARGWCFWECSALNGEIITVVRDKPPLTEKEEMELMRQLAIIAEGFPDKASREWLGTVYKVSELELLSDATSVHLLHEAKKMGAVIEEKPE